MFQYDFLKVLPAFAGGVTLQLFSERGWGRSEKGGDFY